MAVQDRAAGLFWTVTLPKPIPGRDAAGPLIVWWRDANWEMVLFDRTIVIVGMAVRCAVAACSYSSRRRILANLGRSLDVQVLGNHGIRRIAKLLGAGNGGVVRDMHSGWKNYGPPVQSGGPITSLRGGDYFSSFFSA